MKQTSIDTSKSGKIFDNNLSHEVELACSKHNKILIIIMIALVVMIIFLPLQSVKDLMSSAVPLLNASGKR